MISQLSLFDTAAAIKPTYKVGDLVRLRKKPMAASYVKKGDFVVVDAIHPVDGSVKFWNERSERWEFLQHDEISSIIPKVQIVDTELIASPVDDSVSSKAISTYRPRGTARSGEYFRFSYRDGSRMRHVHIRGCNTDSDRTGESGRSAIAPGRRNPPRRDSEVTPRQTLKRLTVLPDPSKHEFVLAALESLGRGRELFPSNLALSSR